MTPPATPTPAVEPLDYETGPVPLPSLRQRTVAGFVWVTISVVSNKFVGFAATLVLARYLTRDDFGLISLTLAAATFALLLRESGVTQVLVQRGDRFDEWAGPAFGLITCLSLLTAVLLAAGARPLAAWYGDARLVPMLYVIALTCPLAGLGNVAVARLEHDLRFRALGVIGTSITVLQYVIYAALAVAGVGAMSFVWGLFGSTAVRLVWLWSLSRPRAERFFDTRAWGGLLADSLWVLGVAVFGTIVGQYDRLVLGKAADLPTVGLYFFAFGLTTQTSQMLASTLGGVLFPALSRLSDRPERQREVFVELARLLSCVATPVCVLQVILAKPIVALFGRQWDAAVPLVQVLSVGMAFAVCAVPSVALMQSQGRFRTQFLAQVAFTAAYMAVVTAAAFWPGDVALAVAVAVTAYYGVFGPVGVQLAVRNWTPPWKESVHIFLPGFTVAACGALTATAAWALSGGVWPAAAAYAGGAAAGAGLYRADVGRIVRLARAGLSSAALGG